MPPTERTESRGPGRPGYDLESLLAVAVQVFNERGYDGTSMEQLAQRLGISKGAIYHHVASKEALLGLALQRAHAGLAEVTGRVRVMEAPALARLEQLVHDSVLVLVEELPFVTLLLRVRGNTEVERQALARRREFDRFTAQLVEEAVAEGAVRSDIDPSMTARMIFGLVNSLVEWYRPRDPDTSEAVATAVCAMAFDGLRSRAAG